MTTIPPLAQTGLVQAAITLIMLILLHRTLMLLTLLPNPRTVTLDMRDLNKIIEVNEPGYVYLPSRFWSVPQKRPPPCTPSTKPKVCPIFTDGVPEGALEWRSTVRERQLRAAVRPAHARHRRVPKMDYYYPGYYAKKAR